MARMEFRDAADVSPAWRAIYRAIEAIPAGRVASYGEIAARAGLPGRARMVGQALRGTPDGLELPWHRVLHADGSVALRRGGSAWREQCRRLRAEGITVRAGRVPMTAFGLRHDLDAALWGEPEAGVGKGARDGG